jgi:hypothetical protein
VLERALVADTIWSQKMPMVLGRAYLAVGRYDDAIREFRQPACSPRKGSRRRRCSPMRWGSRVGPMRRPPSPRNTKCGRPPRLPGRWISCSRTPRTRRHRSGARLAGADPR